MSHVHEWVRDLSRGRYVCSCGVVGYTAQNLPGQYRTATKYIQAYRCHKQLEDKRHCSAEAVFVSGDRQASRCAAHTQEKPKC